MAQILRQIVASPRVRHESGLDLVYVTDNIIAMSMPALSPPQSYYRNPLSTVLSFLNKSHSTNWKIFEFRAEGTGYTDADFDNRVFHSPWPDHHPPPFALIPNIMAAIRNHLNSGEGKVAVVHCKAGKGRTGTVTVSYLISEEGWEMKDALERFTKRRMRSGFGEGVSIPSQLRYVGYVNRWASEEFGKVYVERSCEVTEVRVWGLGRNVKMGLLGYVDEGRVIKCFHQFGKEEKVEVVKAEKKEGSDDEEGELVVYRPAKRVVLPTNDICIDLEKRTRGAAGWTFVSALAHCWFNTYFESPGNPHATSGEFTQQWEKMDGLKGTLKKGIRIFDKIQIHWRVVPDSSQVTIVEPTRDQSVHGTRKADTNVDLNHMDPMEGRDLGLRPVRAGDEGGSVAGGSSITGGGDKSKEGSISSSVKDLVLRDKEDADREDKDDGYPRDSDSEVAPGDSVSARGKASTTASSVSGAGVTRKTAGGDSIDSPSTGDWTTTTSSSATAVSGSTAVTGGPVVPDAERVTSPESIRGRTDLPAGSASGTVTTNPETALASTNEKRSETEDEETDRNITATTANREAVGATTPVGTAAHMKVGMLVQDKPEELAN